jgi:hypothetical protein
MSTPEYLIASSVVVSLAQASDDGLTLSEIIDSLPTDPGSIFVILLMVGFFGLILYFGIIRAGGETGEDEGEHPPAENLPDTQDERAEKKGA